MIKRFCGSLVTLLLLAAFFSGCRQEPASTTPSQTEITGQVTEDITAVPLETTADTLPETTTAPENGDTQDYVAQLSLDFSSETIKQLVTVKTFVDGDTTHFRVPESLVPGGVLKARYLAVNTPESTGKIEEYGKTAALFTREKLENAAEILIETDGRGLESDTTGDRYLVWVWYKESPEGPYRNLNLELLQNGLAIGNSTANNRYGEICSAALAQARNQKLGLYSGEKDPNFFYGDAMELSLKEIRLHLKEYEGRKVAFEGVIARGIDGTVYVEEYDPEWDMYFGMAVYLGYGLSGDAMNIMTVGNRVRVVGTLQYYEAGDSWQVSGIGYRAMKPDDPNNVRKLGDGFSAAYPVVDPSLFAEGKITDSDSGESFGYAFLVQDTSIAMEGLVIKQVVFPYSSTIRTFWIICGGPDGGDVNLQCKNLEWPYGPTPANALQFVGKTISFKGIVLNYYGSYEIRIVNAEDLNISKY